MPVCLTEINGTTVLERLAICLYRSGFKRLVVITGHYEQQLRNFFNRKSYGLKIEYIFNSHFDTTKNIYSLWLARNEIQEGFLLIDGNIVFEPELLKDFIYPDKIAVSRRLPWMKGRTVTMDSQNRLVSITNSDETTSGHLLYKAVQIYCLSQESWRSIVTRLEGYVAARRVKDFYEGVLNGMISNGTLCLECIEFDCNSWYAVDTLKDLRNADRLFSEIETL